jgi:hypothetical protein
MRENLGKMIKELEDYKRYALYPFPTKQVGIDLDDGVKINYSKLGLVLRKIPGRDAKEEDQSSNGYGNGATQDSFSR